MRIDWQLTSWAHHNVSEITPARAGSGAHGSIVDKGTLLVCVYGISLGNIECRN